MERVLLLRLSFQLTLQMQLEWHLKSLPIFRIDFEKIQENFHRFAFIECVSSLSASFHLNNLLIAFRIISNLRVWLLS